MYEKTAVMHQQLQIFEGITTQLIWNWTPCENNHSPKAPRDPMRLDHQIGREWS